MHPCCRNHPPLDVHLVSVLFVLFLLWRCCDTSDPMNALQFSASNVAKQQYADYRESTCRDDQEFQSLAAYLEWEENEFLQQLRSTILPEVANGDYRSLYGKPEMDLLPQHMFQAERTSLCSKNNETAEKETRRKAKADIEKHEFEDAVLDLVFKHDA